MKKLMLLGLVVLSGCASYNDEGCLTDKDVLQSALYDAYINSGTRDAYAQKMSKFYANEIDLEVMCITQDRIEEFVSTDYSK